MWKFMQLRPQKARGKLVESIWDDPNWVAEEKYDGDRRIAQFCEKVVRFTGCRESVDGTGFVEKTANVPHLSRMWASPSRNAPKGACFPPTALDGTVLDGEMIFPLSEAARAYGAQPGGLSKYVTSIMGSLPEEAIRKQVERGWLHYVVFDCLFYKGEDIRSQPLEVRQERASYTVLSWENPYVSMAKQRAPEKKFFDEIVDAGGEGVVLKRLDHTYGNEKLWVKVKKEATADVVIMGFKPAKTESKKKGSFEKTAAKYAGKVGSVKIGQTSTPGNAERFLMQEVGSARGFDDALMEDFTDHPKKYIGKVIEIKHNGREPTGKFRHPRFSRFRDDKNPKDCVFDLEET